MTGIRPADGHPTTSVWNFYSHAKGWPCGEVHTFTNYSGVGLDVYVDSTRQ